MLRNPIVFFICSLSFLIGFTVYFLTVIQYGVTDLDVLPLRSNPRKIYDSMRDGSYPELGRSWICVYLQTMVPGEVASSDFLSSLNAFSGRVMKIDGVIATSSMVNAPGIRSAMNLTEYKAMYLAGNSSFTSYMAFPLGMTDYNTATYMKISLSYHQYSKEAIRVVKEVRHLLKKESGVYFTYPTSSPHAGNNILSYSGVSGAPAVTFDLYTDFSSVLPAWLGILLASTFLLLMLMTNSLLIPLKVWLNISDIHFFITFYVFYSST